MFENLCTLPLSSHLFTQALHPTEPILAVGLAGGHVESFRLPSATTSNSANEEEVDLSIISTGTSTIDTEWRTRRHRGSCRSLGYSHDGEALYSAGTDGIVKVASSHTGRVFAKIAIPPTLIDSVDEPSLLHTLSPQTLILSTDSATVYVYDIRQSNSIVSKPAQTYQPHDDYITSFTPLPPNASSASGFSRQWVSTGGTTLAVTDLRKGVLSKSEDQEEELLSSVFVDGLPVKPGKSRGEKLVVGDSNGFLTLWEKGFWDDQQERIKVAVRNRNGRSLESLTVFPEGMGDGNKHVVVGVEDGYIRIIKLGPNRVISTLQHDEVEGVVALNFDVHSRLISGGGINVKVWEERIGLSDDDDEEDNESYSDDEDPLEEKRLPDDEESLEQMKMFQPKENDKSDRIEEGFRLKSQRKQEKSPEFGTMNAHGILKVNGLD